MKTDGWVALENARLAPTAMVAMQRAMVPIR
jgi:hypothetical protein